MARDNRNNDWKDRLNVVYSTNPDFRYETADEEEAETVNPEAVVPPPKTVVPPLPPVPQGTPFALPAPYGSGTASPSSSQAGQRDDYHQRY